LKHHRVNGIIPLYVGTSTSRRIRIFLADFVSGSFNSFEHGLTRRLAYSFLVSNGINPDTAEMPEKLRGMYSIVVQYSELGHKNWHDSDLYRFVVCLKWLCSIAMNWKIYRNLILVAYLNCNL
jgi:hypothetical protein